MAERGEDHDRGLSLDGDRAGGRPHRPGHETGTAIRGAGGILLDKDGVRFMPEYHRPARARKKQRVLHSLPEIPVPGLDNLREIADAAHEVGATGSVLNPLFQESFKVGKRVRSETRIS